MKQPTLIAGNWKMNFNPVESTLLGKNILEGIQPSSETQILICPPFTSLHALQGILGKKKAIYLGAQNMHPEAQGPFTGEISAGMLKSLGVSHVILGHSERRTLLHEDNAFIAKKLQAALKAQLKPILCIGESQQEREQSKTEVVIEAQLSFVLNSISAEQVSKLIVAYEPVWAIGTGISAEPKDAEAVHAFIRKLLAKKIQTESAESIPLLYGGSMNSSNAEALLSQPNINGGLIGGNSLKAEGFIAIIKIAQKLS